MSSQIVASNYYCTYQSRKAVHEVRVVVNQFSSVLIGMASTPKVLPSYSNSQEGTTVRIKCTLSGGNKQSVEWYKDKRKVAFAAVSDGELELKNISTSDAGNYECRVTDFGVGYLAAWAVVNVTGIDTLFYCC